MSPTLALTLCGMLAGAGLYLLVKAAVPTNPDLSGALERLSPTNLRRPTNNALETNEDRYQLILGRWVEGRVAGRTSWLTPPAKDLQILERSTQSYWGEKALAALLGFMIPLLLVVLNLVLGSPIPLAIPGFACLLCALLFWFIPDASIRSKANERRREFVAAAVAYLQIVAIHRRSDGTATTAMREASEISDSWMFQRIREEIRRAQVTGVDAWDGLDALGERTGITELTAVSSIMRLAGKDGAAVYEPLLAQASALNSALLAAERDRALAAATRMNAPAALLVGMLMIFMLYPLGSALLAT